jgi:hypothetical protein
MRGFIFASHIASGARHSSLLFLTLQSAHIVVDSECSHGYRGGECEAFDEVLVAHYVKIIVM